MSINTIFDGPIDSLIPINVDTWNAISGPSGPIMAVVGTSEQINVNTSAGTATVSLPLVIDYPGTIDCSGVTVNALTVGNQIFPTAKGTMNQVLGINGSNLLSYITTATGSVISVNSGSNVTVDNDDSDNPIINLDSDVSGISSIVSIDIGLFNNVDPTVIQYLPETGPSVPVIGTSIISNGTNGSNWLPAAGTVTAGSGLNVTGAYNTGSDFYGNITVALDNPCTTPGDLEVTGALSIVDEYFFPTIGATTAGQVITSTGGLNTAFQEISTLLTSTGSSINIGSGVTSNLEVNLTTLASNIVSNDSTVTADISGGKLNLQATGGGGGSYTSYTPILSFEGVTTGITYVTQSGWYIQIGNLVFFALNILLSSKGAAVGSASITLPTTTPTSLVLQPLYIVCGNIQYAATPNVSNLPIGIIPNSGNEVSLYIQNGTAIGGSEIAPMTNAMFANGSYVNMSGSYISL